LPRIEADDFFLELSAQDQAAALLTWTTASAASGFAC